MNNTSETALAGHIRQLAEVLPDVTLLTFVTIGTEAQFVEETRTLLELYDNGQTLARGLQNLGINAGDNIALMMNNHPEFVETMVASSILGATFVPIDPRAIGTKLHYMLDLADCRGIVCADYCLKAVLTVAERCDQLRWLIVVPTEQGLQRISITGLELCSYPKLLAARGSELPLTEYPLDWPMFLMFTSGTTGNPKAVVNTHRKFMMMGRLPETYGITRADKYYTGLPLSHINAQSTLAGALGQGIPAVFSRKFTKSLLWDICRHYGCTTFNLLGGMIPEVFAMPERPDDAMNPVRSIVSSGMPSYLWKAFEKRFDVSLTEGYGATEGGGMRNPPGCGPVGSIGKPSTGWIADILDEHGRPCPPNLEAEICFRPADGSPMVVQYYKNPEASKNKARGGWLHMGDLGHKDDEGWFFFHRRIGGGVRRNGEFVNTALVESVLSRSPLVADVFVYGVAAEHNVGDEKTLVAAILPSDKTTFSEAELLRYCRQTLEKNDIPEIIQVLDEIPKTISEKPIEKACLDLLQLR